MNPKKELLWGLWVTQWGFGKNDSCFNKGRREVFEVGWSRGQGWELHCSRIYRESRGTPRPGFDSRPDNLLIRGCGPSTNLLVFTRTVNT